MPKGNRGGQRATVESRIHAMAQKGQMPGYIMGGSRQDQIKAFEAINREYSYSQEQQAYLDRLKVTDQADRNRLYIRRLDGGVSLMTYPSGASQEAKDGALKMFVYNKKPAAPVERPRRDNEIDGSGRPDINKRYPNADPKLRSLAAQGFKVYDKLPKGYRRSRNQRLATEPPKGFYWAINGPDDVSIGTPVLVKGR